jgi:hypothetical protein
MEADSVIEDVELCGALGFGGDGQSEVAQIARSSLDDQLWRMVDDE